jgi:hypothetical protein
LLRDPAHGEEWVGQILVSNVADIELSETGDSRKYKGHFTIEVADNEAQFLGIEKVR